MILLVSSSGMTLSLLIVVVAFFVEKIVAEDSDLYNIMGVLSLVGLVGLAGSVATLANWTTSWAITMTANLLLTWSGGGTFTVYACVAAFTIVFVPLWVPET